MPSFKFMKRSNAFEPPRQKPIWGGVCSEKEFRKILKRERARIDRSGGFFSLVTFEVGNQGADTALVRHLLEAIHRRIRLTDQVGCLDEQRVGVILHHTSSDDAWSFADCIRKNISSTVPSLNCGVYTYPSIQGTEENGPEDGGKHPVGDGHGQGNSPHPEDDSAPMKPTMEKVPASSSRSFSWTSVEGEDFMPSCQEIRKLLGREIPVWKRYMDIIGSFFGLLVSSPLLLLISVLIEIASPGPVFFKQERVGYAGKRFIMYKFRTMKIGAETSEHQQYIADLIYSCTADEKRAGEPMTKLDDDPQIIPFLKIFRFLFFDELPQLINVLRGEMSLVGPRPPIPYEVEEYLPWYEARFDVLPGLTGLWQVSGKNRLSFKEMIRLDLQYIKNRSFLFDVKILLKTPIAILSEIKVGLVEEEVEEMGVMENV